MQKVCLAHSERIHGRSLSRPVRKAGCLTHYGILGLILRETLTRVV